MADYLQPVGKAWRILSLVVCTVASLICLLISLLLWTDMVRRRSFEYEGKPLWMAGALVAIIGMAAAFISWRLAQRNPAANGVTVLPTWFIQFFGLLLLLGLCFMAYVRSSPLFIFEGVFICLAMIFVGKHIARRQRDHDRAGLKQR